MAYLRLKDYYAFIQADNLQQVIRNDDSLRLQAELGAQTTITSYLVQKYNLSDQFRDLLLWSPTRKYYAKQLVDLNFTAYSATSLYAVDDCVLNAGKSYKCKTAILVAEAFNATKWDLLGNQYDLFNIPTPYPEFNYLTNYVIGDKVFYKDKVYQCKVPSISLSHSQALQFGEYNNLPLNNVFPDNVTYGVSHWGVGIPYSITGLSVVATPSDFTAWSSVTAYTTNQRASKDSIIWEAVKNNINIAPGTDISAWQPVSWLSGDNRNADMVEHFIDIVLYKLHKGIAPQNIPALRVKAYDDAIDWLKGSALGNLTLAVDKIQPKSGNRIRYGGNIKKVNDY